MVRREFLKLSGLFSTALLMQIHPVGKAASFVHHPIEVAAHGKHYRGTPDGKIFVSADAGKNWQLHTNFGSELPILDLWTNLWGQMHAQLGFAGHRFELTLAKDGRTWRTM